MPPRSNKRKKQRDRETGLGRKLALVSLVLLLSGASVFGAVLLYKRVSGPAYAFLNRLAPVRKIVIEGNRRISKSELAGLVDTRGRNMFTLVPGRARERMLAFPWISEAGIRKEFPSTLRVRVMERVPVALLLKKNVFYYLDSYGEKIEKVAGRDVPFLPVVTGAGGAVSPAAMKLVRALGEKRVLERVDSVEISLKDPDCIVMHLDGLVMKMGTDDFSKKLERWLDIESEVYRRRIKVDHVDLRFTDKVILTPLKASAGRG